MDFKPFFLQHRDATDAQDVMTSVIAIPNRIEFVRAVNHDNGGSMRSVWMDAQGNITASITPVVRKPPLVTGDHPATFAGYSISGTSNNEELAAAIRLMHGQLQHKTALDAKDVAMVDTLMNGMFHNIPMERDAPLPDLGPRR